VQDERHPLSRGEPFQHDLEGDAHGVGESDLVGRITGSTRLDVGVLQDGGAYP